MKLQTPKMVQFYAHISPIFSCWVTNLIYYLCTHVSVAFATLVSTYLTEPLPTTDTLKSHELCILLLINLTLNHYRKEQKQ